MSGPGIGLIGTGFIGKAHALAYRAAPAVFGVPAPRLEILADLDLATAEGAATEFGFARATSRWQDVVADPAVDIVDITTPNHLHEPIALAAIAAGKHVYCEKPLAPRSDAARRMVEAATDRGVHTMVGFNYLKAPVVQLAREIIERGEIGDVFGYRGSHLEDYMHDPGTLVNSWRLQTEQGDGVASDLGSHAISMARYLVGPVERVAARRVTVVPERRDAAGAAIAVEVPDTVHTVIEFDSGATGTIDVSWMAAGHKHSITAEVWGTQGTVAFDLERLNELRIYGPDQAPGREGFTTILAGPAHPDYAAFVPAPGHQLGFIDLKTIEVKDLLAGVIGAGPPPWPDFAEAYQVQLVLDALRSADETGSWVSVSGR